MCIRDRYMGIHLKMISNMMAANIANELNLGNFDANRGFSSFQVGNIFCLIVGINKINDNLISKNGNVVLNSVWILQNLIKHENYEKIQGFLNQTTLNLLTSLLRHENDLVRYFVTQIFQNLLEKDDLTIHFQKPDNISVLLHCFRDELLSTSQFIRTSSLRILSRLNLDDEYIKERFLQAQNGDIFYPLLESHDPSFKYEYVRLLSKLSAFPEIAGIMISSNNFAEFSSLLLDSNLEIRRLTVNALENALKYPWTANTPFLNRQFLMTFVKYFEKGQQDTSDVPQKVVRILTGIFDRSNKELSQRTSSILCKEKFVFSIRSWLEKALYGVDRELTIGLLKILNAILLANEEERDSSSRI
eukprot:TRINITY_DN7576_c0_g1_i2.p1 TRINITY_DN7576_c0_g1~~TRINITY_DN7576_c0_g1_i2.p1  ORF type:complete len:360 (+),score=60.90 TRINITY_DN7576_c0_g1_i2:64-1143(+)